MFYFRWNDTVDPNPLDADAVHEVLKKKAHANYKDIAEVNAFFTQDQNPGYMTLRVNLRIIIEINSM